MSHALAFPSLCRIRDSSPEIVTRAEAGWTCTVRPLAADELNGYCREGAALVLTRGRDSIMVGLYVGPNDTVVPGRVPARCIVSEEAAGEDVSLIPDVGYRNGLGEQELQVADLVTQLDEVESFVGLALTVSV